MSWPRRNPWFRLRSKTAGFAGFELQTPSALEMSMGAITQAIARKPFHDIWLTTRMKGAIPVTTKDQATILRPILKPTRKSKAADRSERSPRRIQSPTR